MGCCASDNGEDARLINNDQNRTSSFSQHMSSQKFGEISPSINHVDDHPPSSHKTSSTTNINNMRKQTFYQSPEVIYSPETSNIFDEIFYQAEKGFIDITSGLEVQVDHDEDKTELYMSTYEELENKPIISKPLLFLSEKEVLFNNQKFNVSVIDSSKEFSSSDQLIHKFCNMKIIGEPILAHLDAI